MGRKLISIILIFVLACACVPAMSVPSEAATKQVTLKVKKADIKKKGAAVAIQNALNTAKEKATDKKPYQVVIPAGKYTLNHALLIYSNTTLKLTGVTLVAAAGKNIVRVGTIDKDNSGATGYKYRNIALVDGVLDGKKKSGTLVKVAHTANFSMTGATLKNTKNNHLMETAGVKGLLVQDCTFKNQTAEVGDIIYYEAIQLDVLYPKHMPEYRAETINTTDVVIDGCTFEDVPRGVGSHTAILNQQMDNIRITNCTFNRMASVAIQGLGWKNCTIENNTIMDSPRGISYYGMVENGKGTYLPSAVKKKGKTKTSLSDSYEMPKEQNISIVNNRITLNGKKDMLADYEKVAISVLGTEITKNVENSDGSGNLPLGDYFVSGVTVSGNQISTEGHGIRLADVRNASISDNTIECKTEADKITYNGIQVMINSMNVSITSNRVFSAADGNKIYRGIFVNKKSEVTSIAWNELTETEYCGIHVADGAYVQTTENNSVTNPGRFGIMYSSNSRGDLVTGNSVNGATQVAVHVANDSSVAVVNK